MSKEIKVDWFKFKEALKQAISGAVTIQDNKGEHNTDYSQNNNNNGRSKISKG